MIASTVMTFASCGFEAARHVDILPQGHRSRSLHGHSFEATVSAQLPDDFAPYPGAEVDALRSEVERCVAELDYKHLNKVVDQPTDENLARWLRSQLKVPGVDRVAIQSTATQGVDLNRLGHAHVWRRFRFQAAHFLPNVPAGHKCGRMHGHGFEVIIHANQDLGSLDYSVDYDHIESMWAPLASRLHYQCLNDIPDLQNPTSENLAAWIWKHLKPVLPELSWVTVYETGSCGANFDGANYRIWKEFTIDSAVRLAHAPSGSDRQRIHGHTYTLQLHLAAPLDQVMGWTVDYGDVKAIFDPIFKSLDHRPLYEIDDLRDGSVSAIARWILKKVERELPQLCRVDLHELPGCGCSVLGTDNWKLFYL